MLPLTPVQWVKEEQLSPTGDWITGWLLRYHNSALMKKQEKKRARCTPGLCDCAVPPPSLQHSSFNVPACFPRATPRQQ